jgi:anti-sigma factor RsiW
MTTFTGHLTDAQAQRLVDGALLDAEAADVETHAAGCLECQGLVASYEALGAALSELELPEVPLDFTEGVLARIEHRERAVARERRHAAGICAVLVIALVAAAVLAGAGAWAPAASRAVDLLGSAAGALRISADVLPPVLHAIRLQVALACTLLVLPLLLALSRLMPSPRTELA